ncbi:MAG: universal stress protein [Desulfobacterales bacterium]|nr:universal stress protein [Desulfobacterales bacterium]
MTKGIQRILCSTDLSDYSTPVLACGAEMAQRFDAQLIIFYTIASDDNCLYGPDVLDRTGKIERQAAKAHAEIKASMAPYQIAWEPVVVSGNPVDQICNVARDYNVDLAIAASHGFSGLKRVFMGSLVERMARLLPFPFLVLRFPGNNSKTDNRLPLKFKRVVVGCNFSEESFSPMNLAVELGEAYKSTLHLLHAVETPLNEKTLEPIGGPYSKIQDDLLEKLKKKLTGLVPKYNRERCNIKPALIPGVPGEGLLTFSRSVAADLIIVGVLHRSTLGKILIGSTTEAALRHAPCPVLVVPGNR